MMTSHTQLTLVKPGLLVRACDDKQGEDPGIEVLMIACTCELFWKLVCITELSNSLIWLA